MSAAILHRKTCPICGEDASVPFDVKDIPGLCRCGGCGFIFTKRVPAEEDSDLYEESFAEGNIHPTYEKTANGGYYVKNAAKIRALLARLEQFRCTGKLLDVGCSAAFFLSVAKKCGWQGKGVEISRWGAAFSREELGVDVFHGTLQEAAFADGTFDVVFSSHVIEHIGDPLSLVREMTRVLRPGGALVTVVPTQFVSPSWLLARRFVGDPPPKHVSFFDRRSFKNLLRRAGLKPVSTAYNVELTRLYELTLSKKQLAERWTRRKAAAAAPREAEGTVRTVSILRAPLVRLAKGAVNLAANALGCGDELLSIAVK